MWICFFPEFFSIYEDYLYVIVIKAYHGTESEHIISNLGTENFWNSGSSPITTPLYQG